MSGDKEFQLICSFKYVGTICNILVKNTFTTFFKQCTQFILNILNKNSPLLFGLNIILVVDVVAY